MKLKSVTPMLIPACPFIHLSVCGLLSYYKWFVKLKSVTLMFNPCMSTHPSFCMWFAQLL